MFTIHFPPVTIHAQSPIHVRVDIPAATAYIIPPATLPLPTPKPIAATLPLPTPKPIVASIIKIPPVDPSKPSEVPYADLPCDGTDKLKIGQIITMMSEHSKVGLLIKSVELKQLGAQVNHVHPLKFLSTIFSNPLLKAHMRNVEKDYFKWEGFMGGLKPGMTSQAKLGKLDFYLPDFAKEINANPDSLRGYIKSHDWEGLVRFLIDN